MPDRHQSGCPIHTTALSSLGWVIESTTQPSSAPVQLIHPEPSATLGAPCLDSETWVLAHIEPTSIASLRARLQPCRSASPTKTALAAEVRFVAGVRSVPQRLKPDEGGGVFGTAKPVPLSKTQIATTIRTLLFQEAPCSSGS